MTTSGADRPYRARASRSSWALPQCTMSRGSSIRRNNAQNCGLISTTSSRGVRRDGVENRPGRAAGAGTELDDDAGGSGCGQFDDTALQKSRAGGDGTDLPGPPEKLPKKHDPVIDRIAQSRSRLHLGCSRRLRYRRHVRAGCPGLPFWRRDPDIDPAPTHAMPRHCRYAGRFYHRQARGSAPHGRRHRTEQLMRKRLAREYLPDCSA